MKKLIVALMLVAFAFTVAYAADSVTYDSKKGAVTFDHKGHADKLGCGLQQFMAGVRKFSVDQLTRDDLMAANRETAELTGIPFMTDALHERALAILQE